MTSQQPSAPLSGVTVLAIEQAIAAPLCSRKLAELGARVIKIERPDGGDFARYYDSRTRGLSSHFVWVNRGKQSLAVDLKSSEGKSIIHKLLGQCDVLLQNLAPGAIEKLGLSYTQLNADYPRLIVCSITGYGQGGPYQQRKAYDLLVQAEAGFLSVTGSQDQPAKSGISIADIAAGLQAYSGTLAALLQRANTGHGSEIQVSMLEAMADWMGFPLNYAYDDATPPPRSGTDHASIYPYGVFACGEQASLLLGLQNQREWRRFCQEVLERPELVDDPRFISNEQRSAHRNELRQLIEARFATMTVETVATRLENAQIAFAHMNGMAALWQHPQLLALQRFVEFDSPAGMLRGLAPGPQHSDFTGRTGSVPALGEHSEAILSELGLGKSEIGELVKRQLVHAPIPD